MKGAAVSGKTGDASTRPKGARAASPSTRDGRGFLHVVELHPEAETTESQPERNYRRMNWA